MAKRPHHFLVNSFKSVTRNSYKLADTLGKYTDSALFAAKADPTILDIYNIYHPIYVGYDGSYQNWKTQEEVSQGGTQSVVQLLEALPARVNFWDLAILGYYGNKNNPTYIGIFPHGHKLFYTGTQKDRIDAVASLSTKLTGIVALAATINDINSYYTLLMDSFDTHEGQESGNKGNSTTVEAQRLALCDGLQCVFGGITQKYYNNLNQIAVFIDINSMSSHQQTEFVNNHLKPLTIHEICERTLLPTDQVRFINNCSFALQFYAAQNGTDAVGATSITLAAGADETHPASDLGDVANLHFINVYNPNTTLDGAYEMDLL